MKNVNSICITGNLTKDPELRQTASGTPVLNMTLAFNTVRKNGDAYEDVTNFVDCIVFGRYAEAVSEFTSKGTLVMLQGSITQSRWLDKKGNERTKIEIIVDTVNAATRKQEQQDDGYYTEDVPF